MKVSFIRLRRSAIAAVALALGAVGMLPAFMGSASAYGQVQTRSVQMSSSVANATGVSYLVTFTPQTTATAIQGIAVDFCSNDPIIGDTCTAPTSFAAAATVSGVTTTGQSGGTWTASTANTNRTFILNNTTAQTGTPSGAWNFTMTGVHNPNFATCGTTNTAPNCTFYARIFTFGTSGQAATWAAASGGNGSSTTNVVDAGGVALSTNAQVTITAKVQETLTFCVYVTASCTTLGAASVNLGDTNGVLSSNGHFVDKTTRYDLASNAASGVTVRMKGPLPTSGSNDINTIGTSATAPVAGTESFGLCTIKSSGPGALTAVAPYNDATCDSGTSQSSGTGTASTGVTTTFAFDTTNAASTYGDDLATMAAGDVTTAKIVFAAGSAVTTPAGIYTTDLNFIATGIY